MICALVLIAVSVALVLGADIRIAYWFKIRAIEREGDRRVAALVRERDASLKLMTFRWTGTRDEAVVTVMCFGEESQWCGSGRYWHRPMDERSLASDWLSEWLNARWEEKKTYARIQGRDV